MNNFEWTDLNFCLQVVRESSVSGAAKKLGVNHTTVSRRISALEERLNVKLFDRSTQGWMLTPIGETLLPGMEQMEDAAFTILRGAEADRSDLSGQIRVTSLDVCITGFLLDGIQSFSSAYPDIEIELNSSVELMDLNTHEADIAFRSTNNPPPYAVGKKICEFAYAVYATRELLALYLDTSEPVDAVGGRFGGDVEPAWMAKARAGTSVQYTTNSMSVQFDLIRRGMGMGLLPCAMGDLDPNLHRVPLDYSHPRDGFWVLTHVDLRTTARLRIFRDFILENLQSFIPQLEGRGPSGDLPIP